MSAEVWITIVLGLLGLGVMAGQGFEVNAWVMFFWSLTALTAIVGILRRNPQQSGLGVLGDIAPKEESEGQNQSEAKARAEAAAIADELNRVLADHRRASPDGGYTRQSANLMALYTERFQSRVLRVVEELKVLGIQDSDLIHTCQHPTNPIGVERIAQRLAVISSRLVRPSR